MRSMLEGLDSVELVSFSLCSISCFCGLSTGPFGLGVTWLILPFQKAVILVRSPRADAPLGFELFTATLTLELLLGCVIAVCFPSSRLI